MSGVTSAVRPSECTGQCWKGTARGVLRTFWDFVQLSLTSRLSSSFISCTPTALWALLVFEPLLPLLFSLLVVFALQSVALRWGYLFTHSDYVNLCSPLSLALCTSVLFFSFWKFEWRILNETFSLETTAFIYCFSHRVYSRESWKMPLLYGYIYLCFIMYFICLLPKPSSLERFGFHSQTGNQDARSPEACDLLRGWKWP